MYGPSVTIAAVRVQIGDQPRLCVRQGMWEVVCDSADGVSTTFPLRFRKAVLATLRVAQTPSADGSGAPPVWTGVAASDASLGWSAIVDPYGMPAVQFNLAPAAGTVIGVRYDVTMFTDAELATYIADASRSTTTLTLKAIQYEIIPVMLADRDALTIAKIYERTDDPSKWIDAQLAIRKMLAADLDAEPGEGPVVSRGSSFQRTPYVR